MGGNSFHIEGEATNSLCNLRRICLARAVYRVDQEDIESAETNAFVAKKVDKALEEWEEVNAGSVNHQSFSGFVATLYKSTHDMPDHRCAPTLAFRGSDFHRWSGLAVYLRVKCGAFTFGFVLKTLDNTITEVSDVSLEYFHGKGGSTQVAGVPEETLESTNPPINWDHDETVDAIMTGLDFEKLIEKEEDVRVYVEGVRRWMPAIPLGAKVTLKIYAHKTKGDWSNNLRQAFGQKSEQYGLAEQLIDDVVEKNLHDPSKDLFLIGHSLGGGLASHASVFGKHYQSLEKIDDFKCLTLNAAGLHRNTVFPHRLSDGEAVNFTVKDEVLSLMQSYLYRLPFFGKVLENLGVEIPSSLGTPTDSLAYTYDSEFHEYTHKGNLFPLTERETPHLLSADEAFNQGASLRESVLSLVEWVYENYHEKAINGVVNDEISKRIDDFITAKRAEGLSDDEIMELLHEEWPDLTRAASVWVWQLYAKMFEYLGDDFAPELTTLSHKIENATIRHGFDYIIPTYEQQVGPFEGPL